MNLKIFCMSLKYYSVLDNLPSNIIPFGLGEFYYPNNWLTEKKGKNIIHLNKYYGETTGIYWIWKNYLKNFDKDDWIGFCQYRRLWLNGLFETKQKKSFNSLYSKLLSSNNNLFTTSDTLLLQPTKMEDQNLEQQFEKLYGENILQECVEFVCEKNRADFKKYLKGNKMSICNMFITKTKFFELYCVDMFKWIDKCFEYCKTKSMLKNNLRLPVFMIERFTSFWFEKYTKVNYLSFARLGNFFLSNKVNKFINPLKLPFTFRMYPTIHRY